MLLRTYQEFLAYVNRHGIVPFSSLLEGWPSLSDLAAGHLWHTGDDRTDPWRWKDIAASNRDCAYGCLLGGRKGFLSLRALPMYLAAVSPEDGAEGMWSDGLLSAPAIKAYRIIEKSGEEMIFDLRREMGVSGRKGASAVDTALKSLQAYGLIVVSGSQRRINAKGLPYGWRCNRYMLIENWADDALLSEVSDWDRNEARSCMTDMVCHEWNLDKNRVRKLFGF